MHIQLIMTKMKMKPQPDRYRHICLVWAFCSILSLTILLAACNSGGGGGSIGAQTATWYQDNDGDSYGNPDQSVAAQTQPAGYVTDATDCHDNNPDIHPDANEICDDGLDNDCDGDTDCADNDCSNNPACNDGVDDGTALSYPVVDTGQVTCYNGSVAAIDCPARDAAFFGQDAHYTGLQPGYTENGDGTVTDNNTGLMWQQDPGEKMTWEKAVAGAAGFNLAGYNDWRLPTIKELYSLILFSGIDPSGYEGNDTSGLTPFIDTDYFDFEYGNPADGDRIIDSQWATATKYVSTTMNGNDTMFGVNFADGRIKGYGTDPMPGETEGNEFFVIYVRGNEDYGFNEFKDNGDGTITDRATGLMWMQRDSGYFAAGSRFDGSMNWEESLEWAEELTYAGYSDWRLPNAKELQSIVDYTRSPSTTASAAIDPMFLCSVIIDEGGDTDYPFYWTSTTHANLQNGANAVYIAFGKALGWMQDLAGGYILMDVHGAGAQRSDPKAGNPEDYPFGHGPQGDVIRIYNYVRCVRDNRVP